MPGELTGWRAVVLIGVVLALAGGAYLVPRGDGGGSGDGSDPGADAPTRGCAHARVEPSEDLGRAERATLCLLNHERRARGLGALRPQARLRIAALEHSRDMVEREFFEHHSPDGEDHSVRVERAGYRPPGRSLTGENLATGEREAATPAVIVDGWMHSPGHRRNILRPQFREIGIGIVPRYVEGGSDGATYTTVFGGRL